LQHIPSHGNRRLPQLRETSRARSFWVSQNSCGLLGRCIWQRQAQRPYCQACGANPSTQRSSSFDAHRRRQLQPNRPIRDIILSESPILWRPRVHAMLSTADTIPNLHIRDCGSNSDDSPSVVCAKDAERCYEVSLHFCIAWVDGHSFSADIELIGSQRWAWCIARYYCFSIFSCDDCLLFRWRRKGIIC